VKAILDASQATGGEIMSAHTIEIPPDLVARLEAVAGPVPGEMERLVREALERYLSDRREAISRRAARAGEPFPDGQTLLDVMGDLCGKYEGPGDLSTNPKYMEGFGED
jgi:predicted transcriptional regulator